MPDSPAQKSGIKPDLQSISRNNRRTGPNHAVTASPVSDHALTFFSVSDIITPRRKRVTCPELDETTKAMQSAATDMAAAAACREPNPLGRV